MMDERRTDYELPNRFIANHKELFQVLRDKQAVRIFGNGERMASTTALEVNKAVLTRLQNNTPEEQRDRVHRMPTLAHHYAQIIDWAQSITASPDALKAETGIDNKANLEHEADFDPLGEPTPADEPRERKDDELSL